MQMITDIHETSKVVSPNNAPLLRIPVIQGAILRSGTRLISGFMPAGALIPGHFEIPWFDTRTKKGYQRQPQVVRINQLASDLTKQRTDLPTAVLLNIRSKDAKHVLKDGYLDFKLLEQYGLKFYVVDGQHRILALEKLIVEQPESWELFPIPFVCLIGGNEEEEMEQFYIVNSTAKSVKTDLALEILRRRSEADPHVRIALQEKGRDWQIDAQGVVERLASDSPIWKSRIRLAGMPKGETTISSTSMVESLKVLLLSGFFGNLKPTHQLRVLEAFWQAVREALRPAFDDPTNYSLQKGVGVMVLHATLLHVLEVVRSRGLVVTEPESYTRVLNSALTDLQGEDSKGLPVDGVQFWAAADSGGSAGSYSSSAGRRVLISKIRQLLPSVDLD